MTTYNEEHLKSIEARQTERLLTYLRNLQLPFPDSTLLRIEVSYALIENTFKQFADELGVTYITTTKLADRVVATMEVR